VPGEAADWVPTAHEIIQTKIKPALDAARSAHMAVFHLAQYVYAPRYPQYLKIAADPDLQPPSPEPKFEGCVRPRSVQEMWRDEYGPDFPGAVWVTHADKFDIARAARPLPDEYVFLDSWQLNGLCRRLDIDTLIYMGFMTDLCLLNIPGAMREMAHKFQYRCIALRDATIAYEYPETVEGNRMTEATIRHIETEIGYTATTEDFVRSLERAGAPQ
jgi:nicotinamidase-related amidase